MTKVHQNPEIPDPNQDPSLHIDALHDIILLPDPGQDHTQEAIKGQSLLLVHVF